MTQTPRVISLMALALCGTAGCMQKPLERIQMGWTFLDKQIEEDLLNKYREVDFATLNPEDKRERNVIITELMFLVDQEYARDRQALRWGRAHADFLSDIVVLGLNSAAALLGGESIKTILSVTSAAIVGTEASFNKSYFEDLTTKALITTMDSVRAEKEAQMLQSMFLEITEYRMSEAIRDIGDYFNSGTIAVAIQHLEPVVGDVLNKQLEEANKAKKEAEEEYGKRRLPG